MSGGCNACGGETAGAVTVTEMMFGTREAFDYGICATCGTATLETVPTNMADHYPDNYYSFVPNSAEATGLQRLSNTARSALVLHRRLFPARVVRRFGGRPEWTAWFEGSGVTTRSRILDVGSGGGRRLVNMALDGFKHLEGVDPFIDADIALPNGVRIHKAWIDEIDGTYDVIMFNHSLEHFSDPRDALRAAARRLTSGGIVLIRLPLIDSWAARHYGADWAQFDAPRHQTLFSRPGVVRLAAGAGLAVRRTFFDSTSFQFWASEQYRLGIALRDERSCANDGDDAPFTPSQIAEWEQRAAELNAVCDGDQAGFILTA